MDKQYDDYPSATKDGAHELEMRDFAVTNQMSLGRGKNNRKNVLCPAAGPPRDSLSILSRGPITRRQLDVAPGIVHAWSNQRREFVGCVGKCIHIDQWGAGTA